MPEKYLMLILKIGAAVIIGFGTYVLAQTSINARNIESNEDEISSTREDVVVIKNSLNYMQVDLGEIKENLRILCDEKIRLPYNRGGDKINPIKIKE